METSTFVGLFRLEGNGLRDVGTFPFEKAPIRISMTIGTDNNTLTGLCRIESTTGIWAIITHTNSSYSCCKFTCYLQINSSYLPCPHSIALSNNRTRLAQKSTTFLTRLVGSEHRGRMQDVRSSQLQLRVGCSRVQSVCEPTHRFTHGLHCATCQKMADWPTDQQSQYNFGEKIRSCGGGLEYLHRIPASRKRRRKRNPLPRGCNWATLFLRNINNGTGAVSRIWSEFFITWTPE
jgi:hypothetical protein